MWTLRDNHVEHESGPALHRLAARSFVGRERELTELYSGLADAVAGRGRVFLIAGEPGIGKTRLAEELTAEAARRGAQVLWGRCWEGGGAPAYWPWVQIMRSALRDSDPAARTELLGGTAGLIAQLVPELREWQPDLPALTPPALSPEHARFAQFDAVSGLLKRAGAARPLVLILDDLHAADQPSLLLLQFIARELRDAHLLIVATYRDIEVPARPECAQALAAIAREGHRLPLSGLSADDVARFITAGFALAPSHAVVAAVHQTTEGNPLFIDEVVRTLVVQHAAQLSEIPPNGLRIPHGVGDAIRQRLRPLSPACQRVLNIAAVIGREFDFAPLRAACEQPAPQLLDLLGEAAANVIVTTLPGASSRYSFQHTLIRETLYSDLSPAERARIHQQVAEILERLYAADPAPHYAEIAHHFLHAAAIGDPHQAITYALRAGQRAAALFAYEEAAIQFEHALEALALKGAQPDSQHCEVLLGLAEAQLGSGRDQDARATFAHAATIARRLAAPAQLARAALGFADRGVGTPQTTADPAVVALIEEALASLGNDLSDAPRRARLLARLAAELAISDRESGITLVRQALAMARELADPVTLAHVLSAQHFVLWRSDYLADRLTIATEIAQLGDRLGDRELAIQGRTWRLIDLMNGGEGDRLDAELATYIPLATTLGRSRYRWMCVNLRAMRALWRGQWSDAIALAQEATPLAERADIRINPLVQVFVAQRELGQLAQQLPMIQMFVERYPFNPVPHTFLALIYRELAQEPEARREFEQVAHQEFADLQRERRLGVLPYLSEVCSYLRDRRRAAILYDLLLPYADSTIAYGASVNFGAATYYLGVLAATMARWDDAAQHFEDALARNARMHGQPWLARTQYAYACALLTRGHVGDRQRASDLAAHALATADALGMVSLAAQLRAMGANADSNFVELEEPVPVAAASGGLRLVRSARLISLQTKRTQPESHAGSDHQPSPAKDHQPDGVRGLFHFEGQYWSVGSGAIVLRLKDTKGLRCISQLLQHPGREFHATDLAAPAPPAASPTSASSAERAHARAIDKQRIEGLRDQLDEAIRFNDLGRASKLRAEIEMFADQLAAAVGLGDHGSAGAAGAERARVNVTRAIRTTIKRISDGDARLGRYLATTIKTGTFCSYRPDPRLPIRWQF